MAAGTAARRQTPLRGGPRGPRPAARRQSAAEQYVAEALAAEPGLTVEQVILTESGGGRAQVTVGLTWQGEALSVTVEVS